MSQSTNTNDHDDQNTRKDSRFQAPVHQRIPTFHQDEQNLNSSSITFPSAFAQPNLSQPYNFSRASSYHTTNDPIRMTPDSSLPIPSLPNSSVLHSSQFSPMIMDPSQIRETHAPTHPASNSAYFDPESQSYYQNDHHSTHTENPTGYNTIPSLSNASYMECRSHASQSTSTLSSSTNFQTSDPTPPDHPLKFVQAQLDEIKRDKMETSNILKALQKATENLHKATERIQILESENARLQTGTSNAAMNPVSSSNLHQPPFSPVDQGHYQQPPLHQPARPTRQETPVQPTMFTNVAQPLNQHPVTMSEVFQLQQKFAEHQLTPKFPKFNGKSKAEFKSWYDQVLAVLSSPPWNTVFLDMHTKTLKQDHEISPTLSSKLFSSLRLSLGQNAEKLMMTKKHSWGQGLLYLSILRDTYKESLHRADLLKKEMNFQISS